MRLYAAFAGAVLAIVIGAVGTFAALREWEASNQWLTHTHEVREAVSRVLLLSVECEGALRGHLMTGYEHSLERFRNNEAALGPALDEVERLTADNPPQQARLAQVRTLVVAMLEEMNLELQRKQRVAPRLVREVRAQVNEMLNEEAALLARRRAIWLEQRRRVTLIDLGGSVALLILTGLGALAVRADLRRREQIAREKAALYEFQQRLIGIVGHDLRNPLSAVLVSAQLLLKRKEELHEGQLQAVERIARSAGRIDALGNILVDFTHARLGGGVPVRREPSDARAAVERAIDELRSAYPRRAIRLEARTGRTAGNWDVERITQIASNLISNAIRYGTGDVTVTIEDAPGNSLQIAVHNRGEPIGADLLPHLFEPYKRGASAPAAYASGLGLGLYIVREIALAHGGAVAVESTPGDGTTFRVRLPRV